MAAVQHTTHTVSQRIFQTGVGLNSTLTDVATFTGLPAKYRVIRFMAYDASTSLTLATVDLRDAAGGAGNALVTAAVLSGLTASSKFVDLALAGFVGTDYQTAASLYVRNVTAQGGAATASFMLEIEELY